MSDCEQPVEEGDAEIAVIGMSGRFPGAQTIDELWQNLCAGVDSISFFSDQELEAAGVAAGLRDDPDYVKARGVLRGVELFDASLFGFSPREAMVTDPQLRLFLECAWEALEDAGYDPRRCAGAIGLFAGAGMSRYLLNNLAPHPQSIGPTGDLEVAIGNERDALTTMAAYKLNLTGPCYTVQTFCSTSLVAVHVACQSLLNHECDLALAGGVYLEVPQTTGYLYRPGSFASPDGCCRAFDAGARGTPFGNGVGIVVLKRRPEAMADRDAIRAVIKGSAVNNDGALKMSYAAPALSGQAAVVVEALDNAGVDPETIGFVEAHGTGTELGDAVEIAALTQAYRTRTAKQGFAAIGSVKTNVGHLDRAGGVTALIKTVLSLQHKTLVPSLHFERPHPKIELAASPFYVNVARKPWPAGDAPRRAAVSSFGLGGTNAHLILEEAPEPAAAEAGRPWQLLVLSAETETALAAAGDRLAGYLGAHPEANLADVAYTCQVGRRELSHRCAVVCRDPADAVDALGRQPRCGAPESRDRPVVFMFPGLGDHYPGMGAELYRVEPTFRAHVDRCAELLLPQLGIDLRQLIYPDGYDVTPSAPGPDLRRMLADAQRPRSQEARRLDQTRLVQPAVFVVEYALAQLWMEWVGPPAAMIGYSVGEYVAACLAGVTSLEDALALVAQRARRIAELADGAMLAVALGEQALRPWLGEGLALAAVNGPELSVIAGPTEVVTEQQRKLEAQGVACRRLPVQHAFHSPLMAPVVSSLTELAAALPRRPPQIPYISNVTGTWITDAEATDPRYWGRHLLATVRWSDGIEELRSQPERIFIEVGPGQALASQTMQASGGGAPQPVVVASLRPEYEQHSDVAWLLQALGWLWLAGVTVDWPGFSRHQRRRRVALPTYPFQRQRYWVEPKAAPAPAAAAEDGLPATKAELADWFYVPVWKQSLPLLGLRVEELAAQSERWLVAVDDCGLGARLLRRLREVGREVVEVRAGDSFRRLREDTYVIQPAVAESWETLLGELATAQRMPRRVLHLWGVTANQDGESTAACQDRGFYSLLCLAQALGRHGPGLTVEVVVVSNHLHEIVGDEPLQPEKATILGPCRVIPLEYPGVSCRSIDVVVPLAGARQQQLADLLIAEAAAATREPVAAYRHNRRWVQVLEPAPLSAAIEDRSRLREGGVYLITGGLGGLGLVLAEYLARTVRARLILVGRTSLSSAGEAARAVHALEEHGATVEVVCADVADREQMASALARAEQRVGAVNGIFHLAGVLDDGLIHLKTPDAAAAVLAPKLRGALVLEELTRHRELDFTVYFSSLAAVVGNFGQVDHAAANAFLDALAQRRARRGHGVTVAIDWDAWQEVGQAAKAARQLERETGGGGARRLLAAILAGGIPPRQGMRALNRILGSGPPAQIVVSPRDLDALAGCLRRIAKELSVAANGAAQRRNPNLGPYVAPRNQTEAQIAELWQQVLHLEPVGVEDPFLALGGHSLLAIRIISRLRALFDVEIPLSVFLASGTVAKVARVVEEMIIDDLETLSEEEAAALAARTEAPVASLPLRTTLANGLVVSHLNPAETDHFYQEIFEHQGYVKHGIVLEDGACVFDVGANIGLFTLFVDQQCADPIIYAFEPAAPLFDVLRLNTAPCGDRVKLFNVGLAAERKQAILCYYSRSSGLSTFYADAEEERRILEALIINQHRRGDPGMQEVLEHSEELLRERLRPESLTCELHTLSEVIREHRVERIDLLKIDVQKSELDVLAGIAPEDRRKIRQIVMEVHDLDGRRERAAAMLSKWGFTVVAEQDELYRGTVMYNLYAVR